MSQTFEPTRSADERPRPSREPGRGPRGGPSRGDGPVTPWSRGDSERGGAPADAGRADGRRVPSSRPPARPGRLARRRPRVVPVDRSGRRRAWTQDMHGFGSGRLGRHAGRDGALDDRTVDLTASGGRSARRADGVGSRRARHGARRARRRSCLWVPTRTAGRTTGAAPVGHAGPRTAPSRATRVARPVAGSPRPTPRPRTAATSAARGADARSAAPPRRARSAARSPPRTAAAAAAPDRGRPGPALRARPPESDCRTSTSRTASR